MTPLYDWLLAELKQALASGMDKTDLVIVLNPDEEAKLMRELGPQHRLVGLEDRLAWFLGIECMVATAAIPRGVYGRMAFMDYVWAAVAMQFQDHPLVAETRLDSFRRMTQPWKVMPR